MNPMTPFVKPGKSTIPSAPKYTSAPVMIATIVVPKMATRMATRDLANQQYGRDHETEHGEPTTLLRPVTTRDERHRASLIQTGASKPDDRQKHADTGRDCVLQIQRNRIEDVLAQPCQGNDQEQDARDEYRS